MQYLLILQFPVTDLTDFLALSKLEKLLIEQIPLTTDSQVGSRDAAPGELNLFIFTNEPHIVLKMTKKLISPDWVKEMRAGYRDVTGEDEVEVEGVEFTPIWPEDLKTFSVQ